MSTPSNNHQKIIFIIRLVVAVIILQTLRFKFTAHPDSVALFTELSTLISGSDGLEPLLRIGTGIIELIAGILLVTRHYLWGALLTAGTMFGAVKTHIFVIGINFRGDGGVLFYTGLVTLLLSLYLVYVRRSALPNFRSI